MDITAQKCPACKKDNLYRLLQCPSTIPLGTVWINVHLAAISIRGMGLVCPKPDKI